MSFSELLVAYYRDVAACVNNGAHGGYIADFALSRIAWNMAARFSGGTLAWILCTVLKTKPPPVPSRAMVSATSRYTSSGVPKGKVCCVSTPPPQKVMRLPNSCFNRCRQVHADGAALYGIQAIHAALHQVGEEMGN